jgi:hypothetical protein
LLIILRARTFQGYIYGEPAGFRQGKTVW